MGMSESTPLTRLEAARGTSSVVVSHSRRDKLLNKPADAPSIGLSPEFVSVSIWAQCEACWSYREAEEERLRGWEGERVVTSSASSSFWHGLSHDTRVNGMVLKPLGQTWAGPRKANKKSFLTIIQQATSRWAFSSGCPAGISMVRLNPFLPARCSSSFLLKLKAEFAGAASEVLNHFFPPRGQFCQSLLSRWQKLLPLLLSGLLATRRNPQLWQWSSQEHGVLQGKGAGNYHIAAQQSPGQYTQDIDPKGVGYEEMWTHPRRVNAFFLD